MTPAEDRELRWLIRWEAHGRLIHCFGKLKYSNKGAATHNDRFARHHTTSAYRCRHCGKWHRGSTLRPKGLR